MEMIASRSKLHPVGLRMDRSSDMGNDFGRELVSRLRKLNSDIAKGKPLRVTRVSRSISNEQKYIGQIRKTGVCSLKWAPRWRQSDLDE